MSVRKSEEKTILSRVREKLNRKAVIGLVSLATLGAGFGLHKLKDEKQKKQKIEVIEKNRQTIKEYWQNLYTTADEFIFDEKNDIYAAVYKIPEDVQKDLAIEYDYFNQTRKNINQRLNVLEEAKKLSSKGFRQILTTSEEKEYNVLGNVIKKLPAPSEDAKLKTFAEHGNLINMLDCEKKPIQSFIVDFKIALEGCGGHSIPFDFEDYEKLLQRSNIKGTATDFVIEATKDIQNTMKPIERKLQREGMSKYLGKRNPDIIVTQRNIDFSQPDYFRKMGMDKKGDFRYFDTYRYNLDRYRTTIDK